MSIALSQQRSQLSFFSENLIYFNPAIVGHDNSKNLSVLHRTQWLGYVSTFDDGGAPSTQLITFSSPLSKINSGIGVYLSNDRLGVQNSVELQFSYAYHFNFRKKRFSLGVKSGIFSQTLDFNKFRAIDSDDSRLIGQGRESQIIQDFGVGFLVSASDYYFGLGITHLFKPEFDFGNEYINNALERHIYLNFKYNFYINFDFKLSPSFMLQSDFNEYSFILGAMLEYQDKLWGGAYFRQGDDLSLVIGYNFFKDQSLKLGYSFGYIVKEQNAKKTTSQEVFLSYRLPTIPNTGKKVIRTPRFRF